MKKILCLLLVVTMLLSVGTIYASATDTQQSHEFSTNEELLSYLREYATDFSDAGITPPTDDHWLEQKTVLLLTFIKEYPTPKEYATLDGYTCVRNENGGINCISSSYTIVDTQKKLVVNTYYDLTRAEVMDTMEGFDERYYPDLYASARTEEYALNVKIVTIDGKKKTIFRIVYDDILIVIEMDGAITREEYNSIRGSLAFTETDVSIPVYVCGKVNLFEEIVTKYTHSDYYYKEIYYHYDSNNEMDWALVYLMSNDPPEPGVRKAIYKDRLFSGTFYEPFTFGYGVYNVKNGYDLDVFNDDFKFENYEGLDEALTAYEPGVPHGDVDGDKLLTVMDATLIQRAMAGLYEFDKYDEFDLISPSSWYKRDTPKYMSDYDRDGERTVMDATAIQKKLVQG